MAKRRLSMSKKNVERRKKYKATKKKTSKKKASKKKGRKKGSKKRRKKASKKRKGTIPLKVLEKRLTKLNGVVKRRGGDAY